MGNVSRWHNISPINKLALGRLQGDTTPIAPITSLKGGRFFQNQPPL